MSSEVFRIPSFGETQMLHLSYMAQARVTPKEGFPGFSDPTALCNTCSHTRDRHNQVAPHFCTVKGCVCRQAWSFRIATYTGPDHRVRPPGKPLV